MGKGREDVEEGAARLVPDGPVPWMVEYEEALGWGRGKEGTADELASIAGLCASGRTPDFHPLLRPPRTGPPACPSGVAHLGLPKSGWDKDNPPSKAKPSRGGSVAAVHERGTSRPPKAAQQASKTKR